MEAVVAEAERRETEAVSVINGIVFGRRGVKICDKNLSF
jgi:hypothetical protein